MNSINFKKYHGIGNDFVIIDGLNNTLPAYIINPNKQLIIDLCKRKYGIGKRIFLMSPLHHHYQKKGIHESKIVTRFWIIGIMLAVLTVVTLKLR